MGKTFRKNIEYGGGTSASRANKYRGRNYKKSKVARHVHRAPARKGMPLAYAASARARQQQQVDRQDYQWQLVEEDREEECCDAVYQEEELQRLDCKDDLAMEMDNRLIVNAGNYVFCLPDTYTYTLVKADGSTTPCLVRNLGEFYCIAVDDLIDQPDIASDDELWIACSIGTLLWDWSSAIIIPGNRDMNTCDIQGNFVPLVTG